MNGGALPRYFFHRIDGALDLDNEGIQLEGLNEARLEAVAFASDTLKDDRFALWDGGEVRIEVTDATRVLLFTVYLKAENGPSLVVPDDHNNK